MTAAHAQEFIISPLTPAYQQHLIEHRLWNSQCPAKLERLRDVSVAYYDFHGAVQQGHLIVLDAVAPQTVEIFKELYAMKFPINSIKPISDFDGDDDKSMEANNSSAFACREITGGGKPSLHSYGVAIDINPKQNPYLKGDLLLPANSKMFLTRQPVQIGMVEPIVSIFQKNGFSEWGGHWRSLLDYQHFQPSRLVANLLIQLSAKDAEAFFKKTSQHAGVMEQFDEDDLPKLIAQYQQQGSGMIEKLFS